MHIALKLNHGPGVLKLNCDAAFSEDSKSGGWGWIIRDSDGDVITAGRGRVDYLHNPFQAEVRSYLQGVQASIDLGISYLEVETDAKMVSHAIYCLMILSCQRRVAWCKN
jgi:ribonuclease HI